MEAKELMIGNYVKDPYGKIIKLVSVEKDASMLRPIPLTEDWLLEFGFNVKGRMNNYQVYSTSNDKWCIDNGITVIGIEFEFVHQLQNLYFALTGEELKQPTPSKTLEQ